MFLHSIRWRFAAWLAFLLVCILAGFGITAYQLHRNNRFTQIDDDLERRVSALGGDLRGHAPGGPLERRGPFARGPGWPPPSRPGPDALPPFGPPEPWSEPRQVQIASDTLRLFGADDPQGFYFAIWSRGGALLRSSTNAPTGVAVPVRLDKDTRIQIRRRNEYREAYYFTGMGECVLVGRSIAEDLVALRRFGGWLLLAGTAVLAVGLGGGWLLARRALRPVEDISTSATRISAGNLSERISVADTDSELGRLAAVLNSTFARLEASFAQQKQLTADAAHELRTPLAVLISEAQTTLACERTAAEYRHSLEVCLETGSTNTARIRPWPASSRSRKRGSPASSASAITWAPGNSASSLTDDSGHQFVSTTGRVAPARDVSRTPRSRRCCAARAAEKAARCRVGFGSTRMRIRPPQIGVGSPAADPSMTKSTSAAWPVLSESVAWRCTAASMAPPPIVPWIFPFGSMRARMPGRPGVDPVTDSTKAMARGEPRSKASRRVA